MKVLLVGNYAEDTQHSMLGFGRALMQGLPGHQIEPNFIAPTRRFWRPRGRLDKWGAYVDKYVLFPRKLRKVARSADLVHIIDQGNGMYVPFVGDMPHLVTFHDLLAIKSALGELPYWETGRRGCLYQAAILRGLKQARFAACSSHATREDVKRIVEIPDAVNRVLKLAPFDTWTNRRGAGTPESMQKAGITLDTSYAVQIGGSIVYKNCEGAVRLFAELEKLGPQGPSKFVIVGREISPSVVRQIADLGLTEKVLRLSGLSGTDLEWLYSNAWGLLMTSYDEGFGLPILEAQSCGCPVYATDKAPMTEVGGDGATYINPSDIQGSITRITESRATIDDQLNRGTKNLERFLIDDMIAGYVEVYKEIGRS